MSFLFLSSEPTLTTENLRTELEQVKLKHLGHILEARQEGTKEVIVEEFIMNHPAPSWKLIADQLYMYKYHAAVQSVKQKYLKGKEVILNDAGVN